MRCVVATLPTLRLQRLGYHDHAAAILLSGRGGILLAMTAAARRIGATASEPKGACVVYLNPQGERDSLEALMLDVSPDLRTFSLPPDAFGAEVVDTSEDHAIASRLLTRLSARGYQARVVVADDPGTALAVSAWTKKAMTVLPVGTGLATVPYLPIEALGMPPKLVEKFAAWGVRTVGAFAALPVKAMGRFGSAAVAAHGLARGPVAPQPKRGGREFLDWRAAGEPVSGAWIAEHADTPPENVVRLKPAFGSGCAGPRGIRLEFRARAG